MNSLEDILAILRNLKSKIYNRFDINYLAVLESELSDEPVPTAGLGIVVEFIDLTNPKFIELQDFLSELLSRSVHLIVKNGMSKKILERMKHDMHVL